MKRLTFLLTVTLLLTIVPVVGFSQDDKTALLFLCEAIKGDTYETYFVFRNTQYATLITHNI